MAAVVNKSRLLVSSVVFLVLLSVSYAKTLPVTFDNDVETGLDGLDRGEETVRYHRISLTQCQIASDWGVDVDARCVLCKFFMEKLVIALESAQTAGMIHSGVDIACRTIVNVTLCDYLATQVTNYVENLIKNDLQPDNACRAANFCVANFTMGEGYDAVILDDGLQSHVSCMLCSYIMSKLDDDIYESEEKIEADMGAYCDRLPAPTDSKCKLAIKNIIAAINKNFFSVDAICYRALQACP